MARQASSKTANSAANLDFKGGFQPFGIHHSNFVIPSALPCELFCGTPQTRKRLAGNLN
ncbi:hypothetical protein [Prosthecobacter sp.]|uniref:hypothetical protein n=1 Tax=Prosthecobacter sp. TaxID=1965333 RepID=UPI0025D3AE97|nr:hypothetical protein [Prosthecobacter sp.]